LGLAREPPHRVASNVTLHCANHIRRRQNRRQDIVHVPALPKLDAFSALPGKLLSDGVHVKGGNKLGTGQQLEEEDRCRFGGRRGLFFRVKRKNKRYLSLYFLDAHAMSGASQHAKSLTLDGIE
jgi:hypothetical protein